MNVHEYKAVEAQSSVPSTVVDMRWATLHIRPSPEFVHIKQSALRYLYLWSEYNSIDIEGFQIVGVDLTNNQ